MSSSLSLAGKVGLVTGASSGMGAGVALQWAKEGAIVIVAARRKQKLDTLVQQIKQDGGEAFAVECDVSKASDNEKLVNIIKEKYGKLHIVFNNAGIYKGGASIVDTDLTAIDDLLDTNSKSIFYGMKYQIPLLIQTGVDGVIINNSSCFGKKTNGGGGALYSATKAFVNSLTQSGAIENAGKVRINAICPAVIHTKILGENVDEKTATDTFQMLASSLHLIQRPGTVTEVANYITYLVSDKAKFITGSLIDFDAGYNVK